jgi:hypothetical protein
LESPDQPDESNRVPQSVIDDAYQSDPASAAAEYGAEFRDDIETYVSREIVEAAVVPGRCLGRPERSPPGKRFEKTGR